MKSERDSWVGIDELAAARPWSREQELALQGRCRGALLRDWAAHVARRAGPEAVGRLRAEVGLDPALLPDAPKPEAWYPVAYQVGLTRAIVDVALGGDVLALEPLLAEDTARGVRDRLLVMAMRALGPKRLLKRTDKAHDYFYDVGRASAEASDGHALMRFEGAAFFGNPTWRMLQVFAVRGMLKGFDRTIQSLRVDVAGHDRFALDVSWR